MDKLEQSILSTIVSIKGEVIPETGYEYKSIFISKVLPDQTNPRYFPAVIMSDEHAFQVATRQISKQQLIECYSAKNKVIIGKSCIVNCCEPGSPERRKSDQTIASIVELGENVAVSEVIQAPTIYPVGNGSYQILTGHRRFFAMIYAHGVNGAAHFKVYHEKPILYKVKQFQENSSREDLPQYGKLQAFMTAMSEIDALSNARKRIGGKALTVREVASTLGISSGAYDNYNVLTRYPAVVSAYENGNSLSFIKMKKQVLSVEERFKANAGVSSLNGNHRKEINLELARILNGGALKESNKKSQYKFEKIDSPDIVKMLLSRNILELDSGVDWSTVDWEDPKIVNQALSQVINYLTEESSSA